MGKSEKERKAELEKKKKEEEKKRKDQEKKKKEEEEKKKKEEEEAKKKEESEAKKEEPEVEAGAPGSAYVPPQLTTKDGKDPYADLDEYNDDDEVKIPTTPPKPNKPKK